MRGASQSHSPCFASVIAEPIERSCHTMVYAAVTPWYCILCAISAAVMHMYVSGGLPTG